jgi:cytochrome b561
VNPSTERRLAVAWVIVVAITLVYVMIDRSADGEHALAASTAASIGAIVLALVKLRIIMREFMDVRHAPKVLRTLTDALLVVMGLSLLGTYLVGQTIA